jgi:hypothetical protein
MKVHKKDGNVIGFIGSRHPVTKCGLLDLDVKITRFGKMVASKNSHSKRFSTTPYWKKVTCKNCLRKKPIRVYLEHNA